MAEKPKRLARKSTIPDSPHHDFSQTFDETKKSVNELLNVKPSIVDQELTIIDYSEKAILVIGATIDHSEGLTKLGGSFNSKLRNGMSGWIFSKTRRATVENYILNGQVQKFKKVEKNVQTFDFKQMFNDFKNAFDSNLEYDGSSIINVIDQLERKYSKTKDEPKNEPMMESEDED
jgi:hypothetical protein